MINAMVFYLTCLYVYIIHIHFQIFYVNTLLSFVQKFFLKKNFMNNDENLEKTSDRNASMYVYILMCFATCS